MKKYKLAIIGSGLLGGIIARFVAKQMRNEYQILGVQSGNLKNAVKLANEIGCKAYESLSEVIADKPDYVIEAASSDVFKQIGLEIVDNGISLIPLSVGALADKRFYNTIKASALANNSCR